MAKDIENMTDAYNYVGSFALFNTLQHALNLPETFRNSLVDPIPGVYLGGSIEPILRHDRIYYCGDLTLRSVTVKDLRELDEDIIAPGGRVVIPAARLPLMRQFLHDSPTVPSIAAMAAVATVERYLNMRLTKYRRSPRYHLHQYVRCEYHDLIERDEFFTGFQKLMDEVDDFVKDDIWYTYYCRVEDSQLVLERGLDWRTLEYYRVVEFAPKDGQE